MNEKGRLRMAKIGVVGGYGCIGSEIRCFLYNEYGVRIIDKSSIPQKLEVYSEKISSFLELDKITDPKNSLTILVAEAINKLPSNRQVERQVTAN